MNHTPVLYDEVMRYLKPETGRAFLDATVDGGGHAKGVVEAMPRDAIFVGLDRDKTMVDRLSREFSNDGRVRLIVGNFRDLMQIARRFADSFDGILFDLGMSSLQLEGSGRGFSFQKDEPLLMTYESEPAEGQETAAVIVNGWTESDIAEILKKYGEERFARPIARAIVNARKQKRITTTQELVRVIEDAVPARYRRGRLHPATRTFQALRIAVNDELAALEKGLEGAMTVLAPGGRLVVISFHSLEDRTVKNFLRDSAKEGEGALLTKKPVTALEAEIRSNPRARSAKLRAFLRKS
ncbi:MAG: 16S rRNA (cytosine(1402)-N(4))-methyltransferase RsmH [Candidatus Niyogibacteria bacterium]|nr:16S rRNA (cytosine(1402)-N(4))-methyltransferase RsmH [Candidatus Niyogibacteria bacterium]